MAKKVEEHIEELRKKKLPISARPVGTRVVIPTIKISEKTAGGIYKSDQAIESEKKRSQIVTVALAVGKDVKEVKKGDILYLPPNTPFVELEVAGQKFAVVDEFDVLIARD